MLLIMSLAQFQNFLVADGHIHIIVLDGNRHYFCLIIAKYFKTDYINIPKS